MSFQLVRPHSAPSSPERCKFFCRFILHFSPFFVLCHMQSLNNVTQSSVPVTQPFAFVTRRHLDISTRSCKQSTNPPKCCWIDAMVNRDYCSVKNCCYNSSSNKRTERVSFHKIPTQSHLTTIWKRFIRCGKTRNHTVGDIH